MQESTKKHKYLILPYAAVLLFLTHCTYDNSVDSYGNTAACDTAAVTFSQDIKALIDQNCEGCHNGMSANGGLVLSGHQNTAAAALNGSLIDRMTRSTGDPLLMPPSGALSDCDISKLHAWIGEGAPNN
jgi:hypothetical protein